MNKKKNKFFPLVLILIFAIVFWIISGGNHTEEQKKYIKELEQYRTNKELSMFKALQALKDKEVDAVVSAGPTQALVVGGHFIVRRMPLMKRVAIAPIIPSYDQRGRILLDSGANVDLRPEHLHDFAVYASVVAKTVLKRENPTVALLNIGSEEGKGGEA